ERKYDLPQLLLGQRVKEIRLILAGISGNAQVAGAVRIDRFSGVMPGCQNVGPQFTRLLQQQPEFYVAVTADARIWGVSGPVFVDKVADYQPAEIGRKVGNVMGYLQMPRHHGGIVDGRSDPARMRGKEAHGDADDLVSLLL